MEIRLYLNIIKRHLTVFCFTILLFLGVPLLLTLMKNDIYGVSARIILNKKDNQIYMSKAFPDQMGEVRPLTEEYYYDTFIEIMSSAATLNEVIAKLSMDSTVDDFLLSSPYFTFLLSSTDKGGYVERVEDTEVFEITGYAPNVDEAALICNTYLEKVAENLADFYKVPARKLLPVLKTKQEEIKDEISKAQKKRMDFLRLNGITDMEKETDSLFERQTYFQKEHFSIVTSLDMYEKKQKRIKTILQKLPEFRRSSESMSINPTILDYKSQIATLSLELAKLQLEYRSTHPKVQEVQAQIDKAAEKMKAEPLSFFSVENKSLSSSYTDMLDKFWNNEIEIIGYEILYKTVEETLRKIKDKLIHLTSAKDELNLLNEKISLLKEFLLTNTTAIFNTELILKTDICNTLILYRGNPRDAEDSPFFPDIPLTLMLCAFSGVFVAFFLVLCLDYMDERPTEEYQIRQIFSGFDIESVPKIKGLKISTLFIGTDEKSDTFNSHMWGRAQKIFQNPNDKIIIFTSSSRQEGKTSAALSVAGLLHRQKERILFIEMNNWPDKQQSWFRFFPGFLKHEGQHIKHVGGTNVKENTLSLILDPQRLNNLMFDEKTDAFFVSMEREKSPNKNNSVASKKASVGRADILNSLDDFFSALRALTTVDRIIIDAPAIENDFLTPHLIRHADKVLLIIGLSTVKTATLKKTPHMLQQIKTPDNYYITAII